MYGPKQTLSQKMQQKLSPQQIQLMKLLQIPTAMLEQRIQEELEANPALEEGDDHDGLLDEMSSMDLGDADADYYAREQKAESGESDDSAPESEGNTAEALDEIDRDTADDYADDDSASLSEPDGDDDFGMDEYLRDFIEDDPSTYKTRGEDRGGEEEERTIPIISESTFHEYLEQQLGLLRLKDEREHAIALQVIGSIDDDGYLRRDPTAMVDDLLFSQNISTDESEIEHILAKIQQFDPPGTGARDLQECLLLQLRAKLRSESGVSYEERLAIEIAQRIINDYFDEFTKKHYTRLCRALNLDEDDLKVAIDEILKLNPKPASGFATRGDRALNYVVPDFLVHNRDGELELTLNARNAPDLRINDHYREMLRAFNSGRNGRRPNKKEKEAILFIKQKIDSAKWFIDAIKQRQQTMMLTMGAILDHQQEYFLTGDQKKLRPMILKDIADTTSLDISTVSRVANSKYVQTEFGTKRLKEFFSESLQTQDGEEVSTIEVKKILTDLIGEENKRRPLSDEKLKSLLLKKGYNIARRTVAKYREQLNIPVARLRKEL
ncbi:MAG: RNA polymerase factor sigma-54 [Saprospiraceae bacterium]|nr:RNA polymerase factor sigma-54 [Saprospiraceae bacterium]